MLIEERNILINFKYILNNQCKYDKNIVNRKYERYENNNFITSNSN